MHKRCVYVSDDLNLIHERCRKLWALLLVQGILTGIGIGRGFRKWCPGPSELPKVLEDGSSSLTIPFLKWRLERFAKPANEVVTTHLGIVVSWSFRITSAHIWGLQLV